MLGCQHDLQFLGNVFLNFLVLGLLFLRGQARVGAQLFAFFHRLLHDFLNLGLLFVRQIERLSHVLTAFHTRGLFAGGWSVRGILGQQRAGAGQQRAGSQGRN